MQHQCDECMLITHIAAMCIRCSHYTKDYKPHAFYLCSMCCGAHNTMHELSGERGNLDFIKDWPKL